MESKKKKEKHNWIRLASKTHPGRFYMFNKATGETEWLPLEDSPAGENKNESPPKLNLSKATKTPAQDRLKRLQHNLKANQNRSHIANASRSAHNLEGSSSRKERENLLKDGPSTSSSHKSPKKATKRPQSLMSMVEDKNSPKIKKLPSRDEVKRARMSAVLTNSPKSISEITETEESPSVNTKVSEDFQNSDSSSTLSNLITGIVKKIKEICKTPFNVSQKLDQQKSTAKDEKSSSSSLVGTPSFKASKRLKHNKERNSSSLQDSIVLDHRSDKSFDLNLKAPSTSQATSKNMNTQTHLRSSANVRLDQLRQSLLLQQQLQQLQQQQQLQTLETNVITKYLTTVASMRIIPSALESTECTPENMGTTVHNNTISISNDETEAMDWQPIIATKSIDPGLVIEKSKKCPVLIKDVNDNQTMGDIYDKVNENLLRLSAENQKDTTACSDKWQKDFYYFIIDTNVLLKDLTFVEDLTKMKLCDTKGSMLYLPYIVLQELDRLKMRSGMQEGVKTLARHVSNLLLLTEDVNLRNKAKCKNPKIFHYDRHHHHHYPHPHSRGCHHRHRHHK
ncbi:hypothetical protein DOY81_000644 [Sarcophaga bullata]|nr:hypothetical protein DOY81_000644 [Sarcophaga bullata]